MEGESIDAWGDRMDAIKLAEAENYELYGMLFVFKNKIQDDRPEDYGKRKLQDGKAAAVLGLQDGNQNSLTQSQSTFSVETEQTVDEFENLLDPKVSELILN